MTLSRAAMPGQAKDRASLIRAALRIEWVTIAWMTLEAALAIGSGVAARSISLTAFGVDSLIELSSACVLIWRLMVEPRGATFAEDAERISSRIAGALLFALAAYVAAAAVWALWRRSGQTFSWPGLIITALAIAVMYLLAKPKLALASLLGSSALRADAVEAIACGWLAFVVLFGLAAQRTLDAWWIDPVTSLAILWFLLKEAREAWLGEKSGGGGEIQ